MAHGFLASGDTWALQAQRFASNGYCPGSLHAFVYNTLDQNADHVAELEALIDDVRAAHGVDRVDLAAHSMGGVISYDLLSDPARAAKVERYAVLIGNNAGAEDEVTLRYAEDDAQRVHEERQRVRELLVEGLDMFGFEASAPRNLDSIRLV